MSARPAPPRFDWPGLMRLGLRGLGLTPARFWALTPVELMVMLGQAGGSAALTRARLETLAARYPDRAPDKTETEHAPR
jgi:uncharacterized phage protein (TIGR02216 family)